MAVCVSIFMLTYNQEKYIAQAIEGVLKQLTSFNYELVIGEDCSTDQTRKICIKYAEENPKKIKLLLNKRNLGLGANYVKTYSACTGRYVAICDGDDYWIDPLKLQKQVEFLEENPDFNIIYTNKIDLFPTGKKDEPRKNNGPQISNFEDLVKGNYIASVTALFRKVPLTDKMKQWIPSFPYGDWPTYLLVISQGGKIYYLNKPTAVYRKGFGTSTSLRQEKSKPGEVNVDILQHLKADPVFKKRINLLQESILNFRIGIMASYIKEGRYLKSFLMMTQLFLFKQNFSVPRLYLYSLRRKKSLKN
ncbi:glycosyltransferase [Salinimicrobium sp. WS361]|uniref:glycosyltransferase n=1 Tax=Salinimicrobium sp. WS361 TaxID=3425123 RepID=UPI003D6EA32B